MVATGPAHIAAPVVLALTLTALGAAAGPATASTPTPPLAVPTLERGIAPATTYVLQPPVAVDNPGTADDTYTVFSTPMAVWYVNGVLVDPATLDKPHATGGASTVIVTAQPAPGYAFAAGMQTTWTLRYADVIDPRPPSVSNEIDPTAPVPTAKVTWSAYGATSFTVSYQKRFANGQRGPELTWFASTTRTSANFVATPGDQYYVRVVAMGPDGTEADVVETLIAFPKDTTYLTDITTGVGTFTNAWQQLTHLMATQHLPYVGDTAALGYTNATWTVTLPAGTAKVDLYATVHNLGAAGKIQVNGANWADFTTNTRYWNQVSDPYSYPVRTVGGWDTRNAVTITVIATDAGTTYLALDAYRAYR